MAITDIDISEKEEFTAGAPSIKYTGNMDPTPPWERDNPFGEDPKDQVIDEEATIRVASDPSWESEWEDAYQNYKIKQIELGQEFVSKEEFMEDYQNNMASGGRVNFGLGSIFKSVGKAAKKAIKSPIGKAALLGLGAYGANAGWFGGGMKGWASKLGPSLFGSASTGSAWGPGGMYGAGNFAPATKGILGKLGLTKGAGSMMPTALGWGAGAVGAGMAGAAFEGMKPDEIAELKNNPEALRSYLTQYHSNTNPEKSEDEVSIWVEQNMYSTGGRVGLRAGSKGPDWFTIRIEELMAGGMSETAAANQAHEEGPGGQGTRRAEGGRIGFAYGPDQTAQAAGIMGQLPTRNNGAGVKELDLRDSGGFIPPVGVKEKADDIPAMLSNNEFVMTADAVRAAGGGSVEKGAQVMYDQMKNLENKVA